MEQDLKGKNVLVIGTGLSGIGAVQLLCAEGAEVTLLEQNEKAEERGIREKLEKVLSREELSHVTVRIGSSAKESADGASSAEESADGVSSAEESAGVASSAEESAGRASSAEESAEGGSSLPDLLVPSPAVPLDSPLVLKMIEAGVPVISEFELGSRMEKGTVLAITGTNGKTTTTTLVGEIMKAAAASGEKYSRVFVVGNIGRSYAAASLDTDPASVTVGEVSSFQLEAAPTFHPAVSAILNVTPDHLNRHYTMQNYASIKEHISKNQTLADTCVLNYEDPWLRPFGEYLCPAHVVWFSSATKLREGFFLDGDDIVKADGRGGEEKLMNVHEMQLVGVCNAENVMAAMAISEAAGVSMQTILSVIRDFPPVPHRIEFAGEKKGVRYYNDSKATNPDAAIQGIRAMSAPTILIGGGYDKKNSYDEWIEAFDGKVKKLVLIGQTREEIAACARSHGFTEILFCDTFEECLQTCTALAEPGDAVLLSPACASWGMFPNYEVRGDIFKEYVRKLPD